MSAYVIYLSAIFLSLSVYYFLKWKKRVTKFATALANLPRPPGLPIVGNVAELGAPPDRIFELSIRLRKEYGDIYLLWMFDKPVVIISNATYLEKILSSSVEIKKSFFYSFVHEWLGTGLLTSTGQKWHSHRKMITPAFHFQMLESFVEIFIDKSEKFMKALRSIPPGTEFDIYPYLGLLTLDMVCHAAMGVDINAQDQQDSDSKGYVSAHNILTKAVTEQMFKPWLWNNWIFDRFNYLGRKRISSQNTLHRYTEKVIEERKAVRKKANEIKGSTQTSEQFGIKKKAGFLDVLLAAKEAGSNLSDLEIREEVDTLMFEGNDTTSNGLAWALLVLGNRPDVQDKVVEELESIFKGTDRRITPADLVEMKYLDRVIKETLRLYPSVPAVGRCLVNDLHLDNYVIPGGTEIKLEFSTLHRDPKHFENPNVFNPDNFLPEKVKNRHPFSYLAFSAGPRNCIGQKFALNEERIVLATFLRNFKIESVHEAEDVAKLCEVTLRPGKEGIRVKIYPRSNKQ